MGPKLAASNKSSRRSITSFRQKVAANKIKRFVRNRSLDRRVAGGVKRGTQRGTVRAVKLSRVIGSNVVFPERAEVNTCTTIDGYWVAGRLTSAAGNYLSVYLNSLLQTYATPNYQLTAAVGPAYASNAQLVQGNTINNGPMNLNNMAAIWKKYAVVKYRLEVTVTPAVNGDICRLVVAPFGDVEIPSSSAASVNLKVMEEQPFALATTCTPQSGSGLAGNTLVLEGAPYKDLGMSRAEYLANTLSSTATNAYPTKPCFAGVFIQQLNGSGNASPVTIQMKMLQTIILSDNDPEVS